MAQPFPRSSNPEIIPWVIMPHEEKTKTKRMRNSETKVIRDKQSCMMVIPGGSALRCYSINEVITRVCFARPNIAKKPSDVKTMKMPFFHKKSAKLTETSIDFVCKNRNIQRTILLEIIYLTLPQKCRMLIVVKQRTNYYENRVQKSYRPYQETPYRD
jgi:hypothetical protein